MHATEREALILNGLSERGFVTYRELENLIDASPATIRRDLSRLEARKEIVRVHGGAKVISKQNGGQALAGTPFSQSIALNLAAKKAIGHAAAALCKPGEGVMIDGGTTTFQMCPHLEGLNLQVLTNSLYIVEALIAQEGTRVLVPSGAVFPERNIILAPSGEDSMPQFHAPKLFMGAAAVGPQGVMQQDVILVAAERRLIDQAEQVILLVDSSKFQSSSGAIVCGIDEIDVIITDAGIAAQTHDMLVSMGAQVIIAEAP